MLNEFKEHIKHKKLFSGKERILLAFSGGVDSVVLAYLLKASGYSINLAHCNFKLRGKESDGDEKFCRDLAKKMGLPFFSQKFDTKEFAKQNDLSLQMAARQLRYNWFSELKRQENFDVIATAHHADDNIETVLINLIRGTGINGLQGIPEKQNGIVRPLLFAGKEAIVSFAKKNKLKFRHDSSNDEVKYKRNFLRHKVIPHLKELNPALEETFSNNIKLFRQSAGIVKHFIDLKKKELISVSENKWNIDIQRLLKEEYRGTLLHEFLYPFGFNPAQTNKINQALSEQPGKLFYSSSHKVLIDRGSLIIETISEADEKKEFVIDSVDDLSHLPFTIEHEFSNTKTIEKDKTVAQIDLGKLKFPLTIRKWQNGDKFQPLGMKGSKKLSDFFISQKLDRFEKEKTWLLINEHEIVWVIGYRIDDKYKIGPGTKQILRLKLLP